MVKRTQQLFEKIESYLNNTLPKIQKENFEKEILAYPELKIEIEKHKEMHSLLSNFDTLDFRKKIQQIENQEDINKTKRKKHKRFLIPIAATILLLIGISLTFFLPNKPSEQLFKKYYKPYPIEDITRGDKNNSLNELFIKYDKGLYKEIVLDLEILVNDLPESDLYKLYLGNSYLNINEENKAISVFSDISQNIYKEEALWYTTLSYLKTNNIQNVKSEIDKVIQYDGIYKQNALELLDELKTKNPDDF